MDLRRLGTVCACAAVALATGIACDDDPSGPSGGDDCRADQNGTTDEVRFHVFNVNDRAGIRVTLSIGNAECVIDPLPTSTSEGIELGQWLTTAGVGSVVDIEAVLLASVFQWECEVTAQAFDPGRIGNAGQAFINVSATTTAITDVSCDLGLAVP